MDVKLNNVGHVLHIHMILVMEMTSNVYQHNLSHYDMIELKSKKVFIKHFGCENVLNEIILNFSSKLIHSLVENPGF